MPARIETAPLGFTEGTSINWEREGKVEVWGGGWVDVGGEGGSMGKGRVGVGVGGSGVVKGAGEPGVQGQG